MNKNLIIKEIIILSWAIVIFPITNFNLKNQIDDLKIDKYNQVYLKFYSGKHNIKKRYKQFIIAIFLVFSFITLILSTSKNINYFLIIPTQIIILYNFYELSTPINLNYLILFTLLSLIYISGLKLGYNILNKLNNILWYTLPIIFIQLLKSSHLFKLHENLLNYGNVIFTSILFFKKETYYQKPNSLIIIILTCMASTLSFSDFSTTLLLFILIHCVLNLINIIKENFYQTNKIQ